MTGLLRGAGAVLALLLIFGAAVSVALWFAENLTVNMVVFAMTFVSVIYIVRDHLRERSAG